MDIGVSSKVEPSAGTVFIDWTAICPPAPVRFSTTEFFENPLVLNFSATLRHTVSTVPPGGNPEINRKFSKLCAYEKGK
jgi:hypothetical protein